MKKTGGNIETDMYKLLKGRITPNINGTVYKSGRPKKSATEDAVIVFTGAIGNQVQEGIVTVNIYVPNKPTAEGDKVKDTERCAHLEAMLEEAISGITNTEYEMETKAAVQTYAVEGLNEHFISAKIQFKRSTI